MKKISLLILLLVCILINSRISQAQDFENKDFESWANWNGNSSYPEPLNWHGFKSGTGSFMSLTSQCISQASEKRPGSQGSSSVKLVVKTVLTVKQNGSITNGRVCAGSMTAGNAGNYFYTQRSEAVFNTPVTAIPDSITVWMCARLQDANHQAFIRTAVHGDADFRLCADGTYNPANMLVAKADKFINRNSANGATPLVWERHSVPFVVDAQCVCTDPRYILVAFSTNKTPGVGNTSDDLFVDDVLLIYNPTVSTNALASSTYTRPVGGGTVAISIPYTLTGTMSPYNLNAAPNEVIAELSDASGSFASPVELGRLTSNVSGTVSGTIPASVVDGTNYKVRVRTTNYPMTASASSTVITIQTQVQYTVALSALPAGSGVVTGAGTYNSGTSVTVSATPNSGFAFVNWTENGNVVSSNSSYNFILSTNRTLVANFVQIIYYTINASPDPANGGSVAGAGTFESGQQVTLTATANSGFNFINWTENSIQVSTNNTFTFSATSNRTLVAHFMERDTVYISANPANGGAVSGAGFSSGVGVFDKGSLVSVSAIANSGFIFANWTVNGNIVSTNSTYEFNVTSSISLVANFLHRYNVTLSANPEQGGTTTGAGVYTEGANVTVIATPDNDYTFENWTKNGNVVSTSSTYTFTIQENTALVANFALIPTFTVTATSSPLAGGTITGTGTFHVGTVVELVASANSGYEFVNWTENGNSISTNNHYSFTLTANRNLVANFTNIIFGYDIILIANPTNGGTVSGGGNFNEGTEITVSATPNTNYVFINWTENGNAVSSNPSYTFVVQNERTLTANFNYVPPTYAVTLSANPNNGGTVTGAGTYELGTSVSVQAIANTNYEFINWTENGNSVSSNPTYTFTISNNRNLTANFREVLVVSLSAYPANGGTVSGGGNYYAGDNVTVMATANANFEFVNWTENGNVVSSNYTYSFTAETSRNLTANFMQPSFYDLILNIYPINAGVVSGEGNYLEQTQVNVLAIANEGFRFTNWTKNGNIVSNSAEYSFIIEENTTLTANFETLVYFTITLQNLNPEAGTIIGEGNYEVGTEITLLAIPNTNYTFIAWYDNGVIVSIEPEYKITVKKDRVLTAQFNVSSIDNYLHENTLLYPNPAKQYVTIANPDLKISSINIFSINGKCIRTINAVSENSYKVDVSNFTNGTYFVHISIDNHIIVKKLIITK